MQSLRFAGRQCRRLVSGPADDPTRLTVDALRDMRTLEPAERALLDRFASAIDGALGERLRLDAELATVG
jgi:hypothetical protein